MSTRPTKASTSAAPSSQALELSPELEKELREAVAEIERGEGLEVTLAELEAWGETGEFPWPDGSSTRRPLTPCDYSSTGIGG